MYMKKAVLFCVVVIVFISGCKGKNDVLATYSGGTITRGDFYSWLDSYSNDKKAILKNKNLQKKGLESVFYLRAALKEAKEKGFDQTDEYKRAAADNEEAHLIQYVINNEVRKSVKFEEPAVKLQQIAIRAKTFAIRNNKMTKLNDKEAAEAVSEAQTKARQVVARLSSGERFEEVAKTVSGDYSKNARDDVGYVTKYAMPPDLARVVFSLREGEFTKEPVRINDVFYIVKVNDRAVLTPRNIERVIDKKDIAHRLRNQLIRVEEEQYMHRLMTAPDVEIHLDKVESPKKDEVIFKVGNSTFTVGDLNSRMVTSSGAQPMPEPRDTKRTAHQRQRRAVRILRYQLLKRVAENRHILTSPDYLKERNSRQEALLVTEYLRTIGQNEVKVSENEVRAEYDKFVKARASAPDAATLKSQLKDLPYGVARNYIMRGLMAKRQEELATKWKEDRKRELSFRIVEKELEGK